MNRSSNLKLLNENKSTFDFIIIGGGATGLGCALDASSRGFNVILLEKFDFCKGTSSKSTKLVHGGVRYLQNGQLSLVYEALKERTILKKNAPHLVKQLGFLIPTYNYLLKFYYYVGLQFYHFISGSLSFDKPQVVDKESALKLVPNVNDLKLKGGVVFFDGQFDDCRMGIDIALSSDSNNALLFNYMSVESLIKVNNKVKGVVVKDTLNNNSFSINGRVIINATGVFSKSIMKMDSLQSKAVIKPSQGLHLVLDKSFLKGQTGILIPKTSDGRVLFAIPWLDHVILGTTDTLVEEALFDPVPLNDEIDFILNNAQKYMSIKPKREDVKSIFVGLRPLVADNQKSRTKDISRKHKIIISDSGLVSVIGGKWTTYRKIAEKVIDRSLNLFGLNKKKSVTENLKIIDGLKNIDYSKKSLSTYFYLSKELILHYVRNEMAINLDDIMSRRSRCLFLNIEESVAVAPKVVEIMAKELSKNNQWQKEQLRKFYELTKIYNI